MERGRGTLPNTLEDVSWLDNTPEPQDATADHSATAAINDTAVTCFTVANPRYAAA
jgi:hypothetical protein